MHPAAPPGAVAQPRLRRQEPRPATHSSVAAAPIPGGARSAGSTAACWPAALAASVCPALRPLLAPRLPSPSPAPKPLPGCLPPPRLMIDRAQACAPLALTSSAPFLACGTLRPPRRATPASGRQTRPPCRPASAPLPGRHMARRPTRAAGAPGCPAGWCQRRACSGPRRRAPRQAPARRSAGSRTAGAAAGLHTLGVRGGGQGAGTGRARDQPEQREGAYYQTLMTAAAAGRRRAPPPASKRGRAPPYRVRRGRIGAIRAGGAPTHRVRAGTRRSKSLLGPQSSSPEGTVRTPALPSRSHRDVDPAYTVTLFSSSERCTAWVGAGVSATEARPAARAGRVAKEGLRRRRRRAGSRAERKGQGLTPLPPAARSGGLGEPGRPIVHPPRRRLWPARGGRWRASSERERAGDCVRQGRPWWKRCVGGWSRPNVLQSGQRPLWLFEEGRVGRAGRVPAAVWHTNHEQRAFGRFLFLFAPNHPLGLQVDSIPQPAAKLGQVHDPFQLGRSTRPHQVHSQCVSPAPPKPHWPWVPPSLTALHVQYGGMATIRTYTTTTPPANPLRRGRRGTSAAPHDPQHTALSLSRRVACPTCTQPCHTRIHRSTYRNAPCAQPHHVLRVLRWVGQAALVGGHWAGRLSKLVMRQVCRRHAARQELGAQTRALATWVGGCCIVHKPRAQPFVST